MLFEVGSHFDAYYDEGLLVNSSEILALVNVAQGKEKADLVIAGGTLLNVYTAELLPQQDVAIKGERIAYVGPDASHAIGLDTTVIDARGKTLIPGLIDGHTHLNDLLNMSEYLRYIIPGGTTALVTETASAANIMGYEGVALSLDSFRDQPIKVYTLVSLSGCVGPYWLGDSQLPLDPLGQLLSRPEVVGVGETFWPAVIDGDERTLAMFALSQSMGKSLEGHSAGAKGSRLVAYAASGVSSCHEPVYADEALERLRLGMYVMLRHGAIRQDLSTLAPIMDKGIDHRRLVLATDSIWPTELVEHGYLEHALRQAIELGFDPIKAIQMVTLNVAEHFRLDHEIGGIAPNRFADILIVPDVRTIRPEFVISNGQIVARDGRLLVQPKRYHYPEAARHTIRVDRPFQPSDFAVPVPESAHLQSDKIKIRVPAIASGHIIAADERLDMTATDGHLNSDLGQDVLKLTVINRRDQARRFVGFVRGFGFKTGAVAASVSWFRNNLIAVGVDDVDIALALNRVIELQGGFAICRAGQIVEELPLPVFGTIADLTIEEVAAKMVSLARGMVSLGSTLDNPLLSLQTMTFTPLPYLRVTDRGLYDVRAKEIVRLFV